MGSRPRLESEVQNPGNAGDSENPRLYWCREGDSNPHSVTTGGF